MPPKRDAGEWADQHRILPPDSPEPGAWRTSRVPYTRAIYAAFADPYVETVTWVCGSQMSKTELVFNLIGWVGMDRPRPMLYVGPTEKNVRSMSLDRVSKMLRSTPGLWERLAKGQRDKVVEKWIGGARLGFAWASSSTEVASHPCAYAWVDEYDRMNKDVGGEGDPGILVGARLKNYRGSKLGFFSTPTIEGVSPIWLTWEEGTRGIWTWTCLHCGEPFTPRLEHLIYAPEASLSEIDEAAVVVCPDCGGVHQTADKPRLNADGFYTYHGRVTDQPMHPAEPTTEKPKSKHASFWTHGLCSPWVAFGQLARELEAAKRSREPGRIQGVVNTWGGELYRQAGDRPAWQEVEACALDYEQGSAPGGVQVVVMGVDVQRDRLYYAVRGFGHALESWLLDYGEIFASTEHDDAWIILGRMLATQYGDHQIHRVLVDSGYNPGADFRRPEHLIYQVAARYPGLMFPSKGFATLARPVNMTPLKTEATVLVTFDGDHFKSQLYQRIRWPRDEPGAWHLCRDIQREYCKQMVSEEVSITPSGKRVWLNHRRANHYFDAEVLCLVAARTLSLESLPEPSERLRAEAAQAIAEQFSAPRPAAGKFSFFD